MYYQKPNNINSIHNYIFVFIPIIRMLDMNYFSYFSKLYYYYYLLILLVFNIMYVTKGRANRAVVLGPKIPIPF